MIGILLLSACVSEEKIRQVNESDFYKDIGYAYYIEKNYQLAYAEFHKALQIDPNNKEALQGLALVYMEFQEFERARDLFLKAISIDNEYADAWFNLGVCYQRLNKHNEAIQAFQRALSNPLFVNQDKAYFGIGISYYKLGKYEESKTMFEKALTRNVLLIPAHFYLSLAYQKLGLYSEASKALKNAVRLDQTYKGDLEKFERDLKESLSNSKIDLPKEDIIDLLEILKY